MVIKSWMVIGGVTLLVAMGSNIITPNDVKWFKRLQRPRWLTFEPLIPLIWTVVFICGAWSAYIVWERTKNWGLMAFYLLVEIAIVAYNPMMLRLRSLKVGTIIGAIGSVLGLILALTVLPISGWASLLLVPYVLWSPVGTFTTWKMMKLNPDDA
ncbi:MULTISPECIES: TspO/MBR family protein [unclassified Coleofasciculus]|uniref:TspO/MBR family protein n=1 Tax=Cyanophyceae TaxID=3028117 RepID=UPI00168640CF|nr:MULTISPECIES: TspO/MBR family protein [unclassified Coleofasciculus]MBD1895708.1 TspO/MBR family protein [Coleofasciculus sp. FACHB-129]MBD2742048.1 TspO/MBR family protein [Coleofasciculus sp. FACHB-1120]